MTEHASPPDTRADVQRVVSATRMVSAALGLVFSPIPLVDEIALVPVYGYMVTRIGRCYGLRVSEIPWKPIAKTAVAGLGARAAMNLPFAAIVGVAAVANTLSAVALTDLLGTYVAHACADPASAAPITLREIGERLKQTLGRAKPQEAAASQSSSPA